MAFRGLNNVRNIRGRKFIKSQTGRDFLYATYAKRESLKQKIFYVDRYCFVKYIAFCIVLQSTKELKSYVKLLQESPHIFLSSSLFPEHKGLKYYIVD